MTSATLRQKSNCGEVEIYEKQYIEPAIEIVKFSFESILAKVNYSDPEGTITENGGVMPENGDEPFA